MSQHQGWLKWEWNNDDDVAVYLCPLCGALILEDSSLHEGWHNFIEDLWDKIDGRIDY